MTRKIAALFLVCALALVPVLPMSLNVAADTPDFTGTGTKGDPYLIYTEAGLGSMPTLGTNNKHYQLMNDITLNETWLAINFNNGTFNGNGHVIDNFHSGEGLFRSVSNSKIENLELKGDYDTGASNKYYGLLVTTSVNSQYNYIDQMSLLL